MDTERQTSFTVKPDEEPKLLARKDGIGRILHYENSDIYELKMEMENCEESYFMTGKKWNEFINFSGQDERREFFILLKQQYPKLSDCLEDSEIRMDFLKLVEATYDGSQPEE